MRSWLARSFVAFAVPEFRYIAAAGFMFTATWTIDALVQGWVVLGLTDSVFWVGVAAGIRGVAQLLFSLVGGTFADRRDRRRTLITVYLVAACIPLTLATLAWSGNLALWNALPLIALGGITGMVSPTSAALTYDVVGRERLLNASAFSFLASSIMRVVAAPVGGLVLDRLGIWQAYLLIATLFVITSATLVPLRVRRATSDAPAETAWAALLQGLRYARQTRAVRELFLLSVVTEAFGFAYQAMLPVIAREVLGVSATGLGELSAASSAGQFVAMTALSFAGNVRRKGLLLIASTMVFGGAVCGLALSTSFLLSLAIAVVVGASGSLYDTSMWTSVQLSASAEMRGRALGVYMATFGVSQIGGFIVGAAATLLTLPVALALAGGIVALNAVRLVPSIASFTPAHGELAALDAVGD